MTAHLELALIRRLARPESVEDYAEACADAEALLAPPAVDPTYRAPIDGPEAVRAKHAGVLERSMDGVPGGPEGWQPCGLAESWLRKGIGLDRLRVPIDWERPRG